MKRHAGARRVVPRRRSRSRGVGALLGGLLALCACGGGGADANDAGACPTLDFPSACPSPAPSWSGEVEGLFARYCAQCHGAGGSAVGTVDLSSYARVAASRTRSWEQIARCTMPNAGGSPAPLAFPTPSERQAMVTWLDVCGAPEN